MVEQKNNIEFNNSIEKLHQEIQRLDKNEVDTSRLLEIIGNIEKVNLAKTPERSSLSHKITSAIEEFEVEHPRITGILNELMVTLGGLGI